MKRTVPEIDSSPDRSELINVDKLSFDSRNPRLIESGEPTSQKEILQILWREFSVAEIALSIAANGYFPHEPLFAVKEDSHLRVVEGNRRLAAVKLLMNADLRQEIGATDLPKISASDKKKLETLPVIICNREEIWQYIGFKHVNGPQPWQSYSKARYISWVHNEVDVSLDQIARQIGDQHSTVKRLYRAWMVLEEAERTGVYSKDDRSKKHFSFSHLYTGLDYPGIQKFLGLSKEGSFTRSPVPKTKLQNLAEVCTWLYGSQSRQKKPVVMSQNPDLRILDGILQNKDATAALRRGLPLSVARDIGKGDELLFRESLVTAKQYLQEARGKLLSGYEGEKDLLNTAREIVDLAGKIYEEMSTFKTSGAGKHKQH